MKKIGLLIAIITMVSCKPEIKVDYTIVSGKIENATSKKATIYSQFDTSKKSEITLAADGSFTDTLKMNTDFYFLREARNMTTFYAPNGTILHLEYNAKQKDSTLTLIGNTSTINNYMIRNLKVSKDLINDMKTLYLKDETEFKEQLLTVKTAKENLLSETDGIPEDFKMNEKRNINYEYLTTLNNYQSYHGYYSKNRNFKASKDFLDDLEGLDIDNDTDFLFSGNYRSLLSTNLREKAKKLAEKDSIAGDIAYLKTIATVKSEVIKNKLLYDDARYGITYTDDLEQYYALYSSNSTNEENNKKINEGYSKLKSLAKGNPSPKFTDYEDNAGGTKSLEDLKGKYVYIDVWATWCGPCIAEIPSLKQVEKDFHGKNIQFLSISIDVEKDHDKWKKMIIDKELGGMQLMADSDWKSQFIEDYMIKGIPRFILLDPQGNIVNANAPRPSDKKLVTTLNGLNL
ncbi:TlpA family protein disulfide reductase [Polaribacter sp. IC073]|uniref:TlpA family protein disulfide reductase n=1 Tax=Polaribacter sp. IC073 TaxID=2508540 RepID=UPI0011BDCFF1|nr:TlpA disulfide reductase family protein [Polaribacter sp. IC073]TXD47880.1 TlpA family protein disulfide reductase [Polaribacter sp. IC073]